MIETFFDKWLEAKEENLIKNRDRIRKEEDKISKAANRLSGLRKCAELSAMEEKYYEIFRQKIKECDIARNKYYTYGQALRIRKRKGLI